MKSKIDRIRLFPSDKLHENTYVEVVREGRKTTPRQYTPTESSIERLRRTLLFKHCDVHFGQKMLYVVFWRD